LGPAATKLFTAISDFGIAGILLGVLIGTIITALIHSSSAMTAIVLTMAANGTLRWDLSAAIVLGSNIGSTIDAVMSSFGATTNAKRTAFVHVAFNVTGTMLALMVFKPFLHLVDFIVPLTPEKNITTHIAMLHTIFNICATIVFLPFVNQIAKITRRIVPESRKEIDSHYHIPTIIPHSRMSADLYAVQIHAEISKMATKVMEMFDLIGNCFFNPNSAKDVNEKVTFLENYIDEMDIAISDFLQKCSRLPNANAHDRHNFSKLIHITDSLENLSDETCSLMHTARKYIQNDNYNLTDERTKEITDYIELVRIFFEQACTYYTMGISEVEKIAGEALERQIDDTKHTLKKASRKRIETGGDVKKELKYIDMVRKIERAGDCVWSIVQAV